MLHPPEAADRHNLRADAELTQNVHDARAVRAGVFVFPIESARHNSEQHGIPPGDGCAGEHRVEERAIFGPSEHAVVEQRGGELDVRGWALVPRRAELREILRRAVFRRPLATSRINRKSSDPTSSMVACPVAMRPASRSIKSAHFSANAVRDEILITGTSASP